MLRFSTLFGSGVMGIALASCGGFYFWQHWQYWVIFGAAVLWSFMSYLYGRDAAAKNSISRREAIDLAMRELRAEMDKDTPGLLCFLANQTGIISRDVQKHVWTVSQVESREYYDEERITLIRKLKAKEPK